MSQVVLGKVIALKPIWLKRHHSNFHASKKGIPVIINFFDWPYMFSLLHNQKTPK